MWPGLLSPDAVKLLGLGRQYRVTHPCPQQQRLDTFSYPSRTLTCREPAHPIGTQV